MSRKFVFWSVLLGAVTSQAWGKTWEIDQTMKVQSDAGESKEYSVKYLLTEQKLWRAVKPKEAQDESETVYSIFDSVRFYICETANSKKVCTVVTANPFDPILLWAHTYRMDFSVGKVGIRKADENKVVLDHNTNCFRSLMGGKVKGSATNTYRIIKTSFSCYSPKIDIGRLAKRMVKKMKTIKSLIKGNNLLKYEKLTGFGIPLTQIMTVKSPGVGPFGVGETKITVSTNSISNKRLDVARLKLPEGFTVVDMSDQLKDVSFTPRKN